MNFKKLLAGAGILVMGYEIGKISGYIKSAKFALDMAEECIPGFKKSIIKGAAKGAVNECIEQVLYGATCTKEETE